MPRIYVVLDEKVFKTDPKKFENDPGQYRSPHDFCAECFPPDAEDLAEEAKIRVGFAQDQLDEMDAGGDDHPPYAGEDYVCVICNKRLTEEDD